MAISDASLVTLYVADTEPTDKADATDANYEVVDEQIGHDSDAQKQTQRVSNKVSSLIIADPNLEESVTISCHRDRGTAAGQAILDAALRSGDELWFNETPDGSGLSGYWWTAIVTGRQTTSQNGDGETVNYTTQVRTAPTSFTTT